MSEDLINEDIIEDSPKELTEHFFGGWQRDLPDRRDHRYGVFIDPLSLPAAYDMRSKCPQVYDQKRTNSCTGQSVAGACHYEWLQHGKPNPFQPSSLFIYYNERVLENSVNSDCGAMIRDGIKSVNKWGFCEERYWPFDERRVTSKPSQAAYSDAARKLVYSYGRVDQTRSALQSVLSSDQPIIFGFAVYSSFMSRKTATTGYVQMPAYSERLLGGHAVLCIGYDSSRQVYIFRNSYGPNWGDRGYGYLPFAYMENPELADDFWVIKRV